jgi:hypothetical protein
MEQINERAAVAHSTYIYPREEDCEVSAGEQQWMVDQGSMEVDGEGITQGHPYMAVSARIAMKRQDGEKTRVGEATASMWHGPLAMADECNCPHGSHEAVTAAKAVSIITALEKASKTNQPHLQFQS